MTTQSYTENRGNTAWHQDQIVGISSMHRYLANCGISSSIKLIGAYHGVNHLLSDHDMNASPQLFESTQSKSLELPIILKMCKTSVDCEID